MKWIVRVNTRTRKIVKEEVTKEQVRWGGRLLIAHLLNREVPPTCEPTGRYNKLILALGLLGDTNISTVGQLSIGGKSPLTGGVKESNVGGFAGKRMARLGIKAIIIEDTPQQETCSVLVVSAGKIELVEFPELKGKLVIDSIQMIRSKFGQKIGIICNGPAGEMMMYGAGIACMDDVDVQMRYAGRGGLGALMGSKGIKAIVVNDSGSNYTPEHFDKPLLIQTAKEIIERLNADPKTEDRHLFGTPSILALANQVGLHPTRNFSSGRFEKADQINGVFVHDEIDRRGGEGRYGKPCVPGCTIQCCNIWPDKNGKRIVASLQYENICLLGSNCDIGDLDDIAELNDLCNQVGVDTIEIGAAIGIAMEAGVIKFGDAEGAKDLIRQVGQGTHLGRIIGHGADFTGRAFGIRRIPTVKGQAMPAYDPRALKGIGVTYVMSPMGADHTAGNAFETMKTINPLGIEKQVESSRKLQIRAAILDTLGVCLFIRTAFVANPNIVPSALKGRYGWELTVEDVNKLGVEVLEAEREFNQKAGRSEDFCRMPEFMQEEPLPPNNTVFDIPFEQMKEIWNMPPLKDAY
jgi:aldehyde:ferredoxin oxidoreductase